MDGPLPIGVPVPGTACHVMDARGRELPDGVEGELWIGGGGVAAGYWQDPELTAERFVAGPGGRCYRSGDRVIRRPSDGALEFRGRADGQVKIRGVRVEPAEIEAILRAHPAVADAVVMGHGRPTAADRRLAAYIVARPGAPAPSPAALRAHVAERLPAAMVPVAWVRMPSLPLTANGKVARERLPAPTREHYARAAASGSNGGGASPHERAVIEAFEAVLDLRPVEPQDDFFALGGHSLLGARAVRRGAAPHRRAARAGHDLRRADAARAGRHAPARRHRTAAAGRRWSSCAARARGRRCSSSPPATATRSRSPRSRAASTPSCRSTRCSRAGSTAARRSTAASPCSRRATCARSAAASRTGRT